MSNFHANSSTVHDGKHTSRVSHIGTLLLLVCGDVHPCPGPKYKYLCGDCAKAVRVNQKGVQCDTCDVWFHTKCLKMPDAEYYRLADNCDLPWECRECQCPYNFSDSFFNLSMADSVTNTSVSSDSSISDHDILQDFIDLRKKNPKRFIISHININSLQYKFDELSLVLTNNLVDCLSLRQS